MTTENKNSTGQILLENNAVEKVDALLPYQQRWVADKSTVKICEKSRRIGLTWGEAADCVLTAALKPSDGGRNVFYIGYNKDMTREFIDTCAQWAANYKYVMSEIEEFVTKDVIGDEVKDILTYKIRFASGFSITALSSRPSNLRGKQGDVVIDEAAFMDDLSELVKAAMALIMWGGKVRIISTHNGVKNHFNQLIEETRVGKKNYSLHRITFEDALNDGLYERIALVTGKPNTAEAKQEWIDEVKNFYGEAGKEELDCIPSQSGGAYFPYGLVASRMQEGIPVIELNKNDSFSELPEDIKHGEIQQFCEENLLPILAKLDDKQRHCFGFDFARSGDLSSLLPMSINEHMQRKTCFCLEMRNIPHESQKQILFYVLDRLPNLFSGIMDAGGNGSYLAEVAATRYGTLVEELKLSQSWYLENMPKYKAGLEDGDIVLPNNDNMMSDHQVFKMENGVAKASTRSSDKSGNQRHGDSAMAAILSYISSFRNPVSYEFERIGKGRVGRHLNGY